MVVGVVHPEPVGQEPERGVSGGGGAEHRTDGVLGEAGQVAQPLTPVEVVEPEVVPLQHGGGVRQQGAERPPCLDRFDCVHPGHSPGARVSDPDLSPDDTADT